MSKRKFVDGDYEEDLQNATCKSTVYQEHTAMNCLQDFLRHKNVDIDLSNVEKLDLDDILTNFICSIRKGKELYKRNTYLGIRQGINRRKWHLISARQDLLEQPMNHKFRSASTSTRS